MLNFIEKKKKQLEEINNQFDNIKKYQLYLSLVEEDATQINNFKEFFTLYSKIWETKADFEEYCENIYETSWGNVQTQEVQTKFEEVITCMMDL